MSDGEPLSNGRGVLLSANDWDTAVLQEPDPSMALYMPSSSANRRSLHVVSGSASEWAAHAHEVGLYRRDVRLAGGMPSGPFSLITMATGIILVGSVMAVASGRWSLLNVALVGLGVFIVVAVVALVAILLHEKLTVRGLREPAPLTSNRTLILVVDKGDFPRNAGAAVTLELRARIARLVDAGYATEAIKELRAALVKIKKQQDADDKRQAKRAAKRRRDDVERIRRMG